jgi:predicted esterase
MSRVLDDALLRHAPTPVHGRYLVHPPRSAGAGLWLVGFHGQAQTAAAFLEPLARVPRGDRWLVASVQGLNRWYAGRTQQVVAGWMTREDRELAIADNLAWVDTVCERLAGEFGEPRAIVFAGFSQGVAMAYRAGVLGRRECAAIVAGCGDVPPELKAVSPPRPWPRVLAATGAADEWYTPARLEQDAVFLRRVRPDARTLVFEGGHEWSDGLVQGAGELLAEVELGVGD